MDLRTWVLLAAFPVGVVVHLLLAPRLTDWIFAAGARRARRGLARREAKAPLGSPGDLEALVSRGGRSVLVPDAAGRLVLMGGTVSFHPRGDVHPSWSVAARDVRLRVLPMNPVNHITHVLLDSAATGPLVVAAARHRMSRTVGTLRGGLWAGPLTADGARELVAYVAAHGGVAPGVSGW